MTTNAELAALITAALARFDNVTDEVELLRIKGRVATVSALPAGAASGDAYVVAADGHLYGWITTLWVDFGAFQGVKGDQGDKGWSPVLAVVADGLRRVHRIVAWTGGAGTPPETGAYLGPSGVVTDIAAAVDIRGAIGIQGQKGWAPVFALVTDGARLVVQVDDWVGGEGTAPDTGAYIGPTGLVSSIAAAVDVRGSVGATGPAAWAAPVAWATATAFTATAPRSVVVQGGRSYACLVTHTSGTFSTDLAAGKWILIAEKGADGLGTGTVQHTGAPGVGQFARFADGSGNLIEGFEPTPADVGLGNVANLAPADLPISDDTQAALDVLAADIEEAASTAADPQTLVRIMLALAELKANQWGTPNGFFDDFADQDGIDSVNSVNFAYDATNKLFKGLPETASTPGASPPLMTSASAPSGYGMRASSEYSAAYPAWRARDGNFAGDANARWAAFGEAPCWIEATFPTAVAWISYSIKGSDSVSPDIIWTQVLKSWSLYGSNSPMGGAGGTLLDIRTNQTFTVAGQVNTYSISSPAAYKYYELRITANNGSTQAVTIPEWTFASDTISGHTNPLDLRSVTLSAASPPTKASFLVLAKRSGGITLGDHLTAWLSRTGGANWLSVDLVAREVVSGFTYFEALEIDLTSLPSGSAPKWKLTGNGVGAIVEVGGVGVLWS